MLFVTAEDVLLLIFPVILLKRVELVLELVVLLFVFLETTFVVLLLLLEVLVFTFETEFWEFNV